MDPKTSHSLDPKLKEVYDRVMNTKVTPPQQNPVATSQPSTPVNPTQTPPSQAHTTPPPPLASTGEAAKSAVDYAGLANHSAAPAQTPQPTKPAAVTPSGTTYGVVNTDGSHKVDKVSDKKGSTSKILILALGILVFFVIYTVVWFVVFGLELPFALPV